VVLVGELRSAVEELVGVDVHSLTDAELVADLVEVRRQIDRLEAAWLARVAVFDARHVYADDHAASSAAWLRSVCRLSPGDAASRVRSARRLRDQLPVTATALGAGDISWPHAKVVCEQAGKVADRLGEPGAQALSQAESVFVDAALGLHPADVGRVIRRWEHVIDADGFLSDADRAFERRYLNISTSWQGTVYLDGQLDAESGAVVLAAIDALTAPTPDDTRSAGQRRADAFVELSRRSLDSGTLPVTGGEKPHITVEVTLDSLERRLGCEPGELTRTGPVPADTARRLACDASITRIITGPDSEPLDVGRRTRVIPAAVRRALYLRDKGCTWPGCDYPAEWTDAHHIHHWADGGPTTLANLRLLCRRHHRATHHHDQELTAHPAHAPP